MFPGAQKPLKQSMAASSPGPTNPASTGHWEGRLFSKQGARAGLFLCAQPCPAHTRAARQTGALCCRCRMVTQRQDCRLRCRVGGSSISSAAFVRRAQAPQQLLRASVYHHSIAGPEFPTDTPDGSFLENHSETSPND